MAVATGCGKPQYCSDLSTLQTAVKNLPSSATSGGVSGLESQLKTIQSDATALSASAKSDFPSETNNVTSTIGQLEASIKELPSKPSAAQLATVGINASAVVNSVQAFQNATSKDCK